MLTMPQDKLDGRFWQCKRHPEYRYEHCKGQAQELAIGNKDYVGNGSSGAHGLLAENFSTCCTCPENLLESEVSCGRLIGWVEELSKQHIWAVAWEQLAHFSHIYSEKKE